MNELPYVDDSKVLAKELNRLIKLRSEGKINKNKRSSLNKSQRIHILEKTDSKCHICGTEVSLVEFEADHVKSFTSGGSDVSENFLASCKTCNNYRWFYSPEEIQWILKLGIWAKTQISEETSIGKLMAESFIKKEIGREKRRKTKRESLKSI